MTYDIVRTIDATVEPVSLDQAKRHCRIEIDDDDNLLLMYITAARQYCEQVTGRAFLQQTWRLSLQDFPRWCWPSAVMIRPGHHERYWMSTLYWVPSILLPQPRALSIVSVTYLDNLGNRQTLDPTQYDVDLDGEPASIFPAVNTYWPFTLPRKGSVQVTYTCGYGTVPGSVPLPLQLAVLQLVGHWYENREATVFSTGRNGVVSVPISVSELLQAYTLDVFTMETF